jgi:murein DD-endopeptidase MepM/ murein hydrolase activator NlpD
MYSVKRGYTLFSIARLHNTTVDALKTWNSRIRGNRINVGDRLTIFSARLAN